MNTSNNKHFEDEGDLQDIESITNLTNLIMEISPKGRFIKLNEELGNGAYKIVYKGIDNDTGCEIAWNTIKLSHLSKRDRKRISNEISLLKTLNHPNIINFISAWINKQKDEVICITEIVTGGSLKKYLRKTRNIKLKVIKTWCREILKGLEYLHNLKPNPIIHRDIKCDNIFINSNKGDIRIGDLGLATTMASTFATSVLGTPEFMAPEMYEEGYDTLVDVYSFGMCVLEMVTLQTPYKECMNPAQIYKKVINGIKPHCLNTIADEEVKEFILLCLQPKELRPTATELLKHRFLQSTDSETDNSPIHLRNANLVNMFEEDQSRNFFLSPLPNHQGH